MIEDNSMEFDMFEDVRRTLVAVFEKDGHERLVAEKLALYLVQGMRDVPKLITMLVEESTHTQEQVLQAIHDVLDNSLAFEKARNLLRDIEQESND
jgi:hypothetical protein